jgi:hypothetical protein
MAEAVNFGLSNIFADSKRTSQNSLINQGQIDYNRQKSVSSSTASYVSSVFNYHYMESFIKKGLDRWQAANDYVMDLRLGNEILSPAALTAKYGSLVHFDRPMGAIEAARYVARQKYINEQERLTHTYMGNSTLGAALGFGATIAGGGLDILAMEAITLGTAPLIAGLGGAALRGASSIKWVGRAVNAGTKAMEASAGTRFAIQKVAPHLIANTAESLAFDPLYGELSVQTGSIKREQYGAFVRNNMLLNIGLGSVASLGMDTAISAVARARSGAKNVVGRGVKSMVEDAVDSTPSVVRSATPSLVQDGKLNLSAINTRVKEAFGGGDIPTDHLELELDARSRGFLGDVPLEDSPLSALIPSSKTLDDVLNGKGDDLFGEIDLQARRVNDLAESPNGFKTALRDLIDEGATPNEVVRALEAYDLIGGDTPTRFQEMLDEGLTLEEKGMVDATMQAYFEKKARYKEGVRAEATLDASDQFRITSKPLEEPSIAPSKPAKISPLTVSEDSERVLRDYVERSEYDKPAEERQKIADAMLASAKTMAIRDLEGPQGVGKIEDLLGLSLEGVSTPEAKAVAQLFNQPDDVIQAAINCLAKEN